MNLRPQQFSERTRKLVGFSGGAMAKKCPDELFDVCFEV